MGYWKEVGDVIKKGVDISMENLKHTADDIVDKTKHTAVEQKSKTKLYFKHRKLHNLLADLGDYAYDNFKEEKNMFNDEKVKELIGEVDTLTTECKSIEENVMREMKKTDDK